MNRLALNRAVDDLATRRPEAWGYGYADTQHPWRYDPAIEQARQTFHDFLDAARQAPCRGAFVQVGLGRHGGGHRAFRLLAGRVVSVDREPGRLAAFQDGDDFDPARDALIAGDAGDPAVAAAAAAAAPEWDLLFLDGGDGYEERRREWEAFAPLVRPGGIVAIADASQAHPWEGRLHGVDRFVADLERDFLLPRGVRCQRAGGAHAIHWYVQEAATAGGGPLPWPGERGRSPRPRRVGEVAGYSLHAWAGSHYALRGGVPELDPRALGRNEYPVVLKAAAPDQAARLAAGFAAAEPLLAEARRRLGENRLAEARAAVAEVRAAMPWLRAALLPGLEAAPFGRAVLLAAGTLSLLGDRPREGAALLRRALAQEMLDKELLQAVAAAYVQVLDDEGEARRLLAEARRHVRGQRIAAVCHDGLGGNVLWQYPRLLQDVRGVIQVGAHTGEEVEAFRRLEIRHQAYLEPQPEAFRRLEERCRAEGAGDIVLLPCAAGEEAGERELRSGARTEHASFLPTRPGARLHPDDEQTRTRRVPVATLDGLVAAGRLDPGRYNLLMVDTEGTELEVLRGARELLRHMDLVCVAFLAEPIYAGAPLPLEIQSFLREVNGDGFALRAYEPGPDPARGDAVFRRIKVRR